MPRVFIPPAIRPLAGGKETVEVAGTNVGEVIDELDRRFPGMKDRLCQDDELQPGLAVSVGGSISTLGLLQQVDNQTEIHFLPAIGGG